MTEQEKQLIETLKRSFTRMEAFYKAKSTRIRVYEEKISQLEAENAALRERLSHSLELPYMEQTVSQYGTEDTILYYMENGKLQQECFNNKFPEQLQARLAELKGEEKNG